MKQKSKRATTSKTKSQSRSKGKSAPSKRAASQRRKKRSGMGTYGTIIAVVVVVVVVVAILVLVDRANSPAAVAPGAYSPEVSLGEANAPVTVVEYADYQCPYCKVFAQGAQQQLIQNYVDTGQVRFVFQNFTFIGQESFSAAEAAQCAADQGQFWAYHDLLFEKQGAENSGVFTVANLKQYAVDLGLDSAEFDPCLDSNRYLSLVQQQTAEAQRLGLTSTPSVLVDGKLVRNGSQYDVLQAAVDTALQGQ
jgi:protein-disulfide isomerase